MSPAGPPPYASCSCGAREGERPRRSRRSSYPLSQYPAATLPGNVARGASPDPVHLEKGDAHLEKGDALAVEVGQVDEHQRTLLDGAQSGRVAGECRVAQGGHRIPLCQFLG